MTFTITKIIDKNKKKPLIIFKGIFEMKFKKISKVRITLIEQLIKDSILFKLSFLIMHETTNEDKETTIETISIIMIKTYDVLSSLL